MLTTAEPLFDQLEIDPLDELGCGVVSSTHIQVVLLRRVQKKPLSCELTIYLNHIAGVACTCGLRMQNVL